MVPSSCGLRSRIMRLQALRCPRIHVVLISLPDVRSRYCPYVFDDASDSNILTITSIRLPPTMVFGKKYSHKKLITAHIPTFPSMHAPYVDGDVLHLGGHTAGDNLGLRETTRPQPAPNTP